MRFPAIGVGAAVAAVLLALVLQAGGDPQAAPARPAALRVDTELPDWRAPGARLRVAGFAGAGEELRLLVAGRPVARTVSGPRGGFALVGRLPAGAGRVAVALERAGRREPLGTLELRPVVLAAVGDVMFSEDVGRALAARGPTHPWEAVGAVLRRADVATANLETAVSARGAPVAKEYRFRGPPSALAGMARTGGIDLVSVANNHALDYGRDAFLDTLRHLRRAGIAPVGGGVDERRARAAVVLERGGLRLAFLGYSDVNPLGFPAGPATPGTARADAAAIDADVRRARRRADLVVVWFHWGEELRGRPTWRQQGLAGAALNAGASVVLGAHPHVLGPVTRAPGRRLVAWSLGNFLFPSFRRETRRTGILAVRLDAGGVRGHDLLPVEIDAYRPVPVRAAGAGEPSKNLEAAARRAA